MQDSKIQWTHHTFNPWRGCAKVSPGCAHCYAEVQSKRNPKVLGEWGPTGVRAMASQAYWRQPIKWDREAREAGERRRVFCASLADVFEDRPDLVAHRERLFRLIAETPHLDWLLLTKRPQNALAMLEALSSTPFVVHDSTAGPHQQRWTTWKEIGFGFGRLWPNVWLGVSVEDQARADERIPLLLSIPVAVRFLSCEPLLGPVTPKSGLCWHSSDDPNQTDHGECAPVLDWIIVGGESGAAARPCRVDWVRDLVRQCRQTGTACFVKQLGRRPDPPEWWDESAVPHIRRLIRDAKGGDPDEWPPDLRVREFPTCQTKRFSGSAGASPC